MRKHVPLALGAMCMLFVLSSQSASAQERGSYINASQSVAYGDLDLNTEPGAATFVRRLQNAAYRVCGRLSRERGIVARQQAQTCVDAAMRDAVAASEAATVSAQYAALGQNSAPASTPAVRLEANNARARVSYADLNLDTRRGRQALDARIERATYAVCDASRWDRRLSSAQRQCMNQAAEGARVQVAALETARQTAVTTQSTEPAVMAGVQTQSPIVQASAPASAATPTLMNSASSIGYGVCDARSFTAAFNGASLGAEARREVGYAVDGASVCALDAAVIEAQRGNAQANRRAQALRAALIARGMPASRVSIAYTDDASALGSRVQMSFSGVAHGQTLVAESQPGV